MIFSLMIVRLNFFLFVMYLLNGLETHSDYSTIFSFLTTLLKDASSSQFRMSRIFVCTSLFLLVTGAVKIEVPSLIS